MWLVGRGPCLSVVAAAAITASLLLAGGAAAVSVAADIVCDPNDCISVRTFSLKIAESLRDVVGFVSIVGGLSPVSKGWARTSVDPPMTAMRPDLPINIASASKILTTIAVLQALEQHHVNLDDSIRPYLYNDWRRGPLIDTVTFRMLLNHTSGFRADCSGRQTNAYAALRTLIANGVKKSDMDDLPTYNNCNFAIFREMLPQIEGSPIETLPDDLRAQRSAAYYISYVNQHILARVGVPPRACAVPSGGADTVLSYPNPPGSVHGEDWGDWTLACGAGGWVLSARDLFAVVEALATGNAVLTNAEKALFMAPFPNCIGWDCSVGRVCPDPGVCKNGGLVRGGGLIRGRLLRALAQDSIELWTYVAVLECDVPVVVIVNSPLPSEYEGEWGEDIIGLVRDAHDAARVNGPHRLCP